jgi:hypothetical protein
MTGGGQVCANLENISGIMYPAVLLARLVSLYSTYSK